MIISVSITNIYDPTVLRSHPPIGNAKVARQCTARAPHTCPFHRDGRKRLPKEALLQVCLLLWQIFPDHEGQKPRLVPQVLYFLKRERLPFRHIQQRPH